MYQFNFQRERGKKREREREEGGRERKKICEGAMYYSDRH